MPLLFSFKGLIQFYNEFSRPFCLGLRHRKSMTVIEKLLG